MIRKQVTRFILMIRPANFGFNAETAVNNAFQSNDTSITNEEVSSKAVLEFDNFVKLLKEKGINVYVLQDSDEPIKPDAIFPNNWISFHEDGTVITYPMFAKVRRLERNDKVIDLLEHDFWIVDHIHMEEAEEDNIYLEGTGSMVFDRVSRIAYACLSPRTDRNLFEDFCKLTGYEPVSFTAVDQNDQLIYHTNVMMALGSSFVVICLDSIKDNNERDLLISKFEQTNKEIIEITLEQMNAFAGNMLQVQSNEGAYYLVISDTAYKSLTKDQIKRIKQHTEILVPQINTIEKYGGGSVRCMMAEIFLPEKLLAEN